MTMTPEIQKDMEIPYYCHHYTVMDFERGIPVQF